MWKRTAENLVFFLKVFGILFLLRMITIFVGVHVYVPVLDDCYEYLMQALGKLSDLAGKPNLL